mmetsp:Transcript_15865/g.39247  ORF Transcript_15865/g.39247 Transcript_15865/m.39247 type:complete len:215 (+) Transcript_15865:2303-2947(+)
MAFLRDLPPEARPENGEARRQGGERDVLRRVSGVRDAGARAHGRRLRRGPTRGLAQFGAGQERGRVCVHRRVSGEPGRRLQSGGDRPGRREEDVQDHPGERGREPGSGGDRHCEDFDLAEKVRDPKTERRRREEARIHDERGRRGARWGYARGSCLRPRRKDAVGAKVSARGSKSEERRRTSSRSGSHEYDHWRRGEETLTMSMSLQKWWKSYS